MPKDGENRQAYSSEYTTVKFTETLQPDLSILLYYHFGVIEPLLLKQTSTQKNRPSRMGFEECQDETKIFIFQR